MEKTPTLRHSSVTVRVRVCPTLHLLVGVLELRADSHSGCLCAVQRYFCWMGEYGSKGKVGLVAHCRALRRSVKISVGGRSICRATSCCPTNAHGQSLRLILTVPSSLKCTSPQYPFPKGRCAIHDWAARSHHKAGNHDLPLDYSALET